MTFVNPITSVMENRVASEEDLIRRARVAIGIEAWVIGECASQWTQKYARGRTDADFAQIIGSSREQVCARRNVFDRFQNHGRRDVLTWSHYNVALSWDDAEECLDWAADAEATVAEMRCWRRAQRGEDLFAEEDTRPELPPPSPRHTGNPRDDAHEDDDEGAGNESATIDTSDGENLQVYTPYDNQKKSQAEKPASEKKGKPKQKKTESGPEDPQKISEAVDKMLRRYSSETQQRSVQKLLSRMLQRIDSVELLLPPVDSKPEDVTDVVRDLVHWSVAQIMQCQWSDGDKSLAGQIAEVFQAASIAASEFATGTNQPNALFDPGPQGDPAHVPITAVLREWNETWDTNVIPTDKRRTALRARMKEPFFQANWKEAIRRARNSPFCCGHNKTGWVANIDWFLKPDSAVKLIEGNHDGIDTSENSPAAERESKNAAAIAAALRR